MSLPPQAHKFRAMETSLKVISPSADTPCPTGTVPDPESTAMVLSSRPFLEYHVRRRLRAIANVTLLGGHDLVELTATADQTRVTGVRVVNRDGDDERTLTADLVIDAMGRGAHTPALLESLGYGRPVEDRIVMHMTYVSQLLRIPSGAMQEMVVVIGCSPGRPTGMFLSGYEDNTWMFTVFGMLETSHPRPGRHDLICRDVCPCPHSGGRTGRRTHRRRGASPHAVQPVATLRQDEAISRRFAGGRRRHLQLQPRLWPRNDGLGAGRCRPSRLSAPRRPQPASAILPRRREANRCGLADGRRRRPCFSRGRRAAGPATLLMNRFADWALTACESDPITLVQFFRSTALVDPPVRLLHPSFVVRAAKVNLRRRKCHQPAAVASATT